MRRLFYYRLKNGENAETYRHILSKDGLYNVRHRGTLQQAVSYHPEDEEATWMTANEQMESCLAYLFETLALHITMERFLKAYPETLKYLICRACHQKWSMPLSAYRQLDLLTFNYICPTCFVGGREL